MRSRCATAALGAHDDCETVTGLRPYACAWWGFFDADVMSAVEAHAWVERGQVREWWGDAPEAWLVDAVAIYARALERSRADRERRMRPAGGSSAAPPGWTVEGVTRV